MKKIQFSYPAFFSYCSADEEAAGDYIRKFHSHFSKILNGKLKQHGLEASAPFIDTVDMPTVGNIDRLLNDHVQASFGLFIFVDKGYIQSKYCCDELTYFSNLLSHARDELQARVWIFALGPFDELKASFEKQLTKAKAAHLSSNIYKSLYNSNKELISLGDSSPTDQCINLLRPIAEDLANKIKNASPRVKAPQPYKIDVLIGAATLEVKNSCDTLREKLIDPTIGNSALRVEMLPDNALTEWEDEELAKLFQQARTIVLPFSHKVLSPRQLGGHIQIQLDCINDATGERAIIWIPPNISPVSQEQQERNAKHIEVWGKLWNERSEADELTLAISLKNKFSIERQSSSDSIRVLIETSDKNDLSWQFVGELLDQWWQSNYPEIAKDCRLQPISLDPKRLHEEGLDILGDAVIVLREEDDKLTDSKIEDITRRMERWKEKRLTIYPGLIAELITPPPESTKSPVYSSWPRTVMQWEGDQLSWFDEPKNSLKSFFRRIQQIKTVQA